MNGVCINICMEGDMKKQMIYHATSRQVKFS